MVALVVPDYEPAIAYFTGILGFTLAEDTPLSPTKRWVVVSPGNGAKLLLAKAANDDQGQAIGRFAGGRVGLFLHTDDFDQTYGRYQKLGVEFLEPPRDEAYGRVAAFVDLFGNKWDLIGGEGSSS
jgi:catechol 2,3-dioxygenase-like lactoylglutathione lyase family enzyme